MKKKRIYSTIGVFIAIYLFAGVLSVIPATPPNNIFMHDEYLLDLSVRFITAVKNGDAKKEQEELAGVSSMNLIKGLTNDNAKKVFWMNLYNGWYQLLAAEDVMQGNKIYSKKILRFSDFALSLDQVEHGVLRRYRWKYSMGYLPQFFTPKRIKQLAVEEIDHRIHFALNCGAKSCPPIITFQYVNLDAQLDAATQRFILAETQIDETQKKVYTSKILSWYRGDFRKVGGLKVFLGNIMRRNFSTYKIKFNKYDWTPELNNYMTP